MVNPAFTVIAPLMVKMQVASVPAQTPCGLFQPVKRALPAARACRVTDCPSLKLAEQLDPQLIRPSGIVLTTDPEPLTATVSK